MIERLLNTKINCVQTA